MIRILLSRTGGFFRTLFLSILICFASAQYMRAQVITVGGPTDVTNDAEYSPSGTQILIASSDHTLRICSAVTGATQAIFRGHTAAVLSAHFNHAGTRIVSSGADGKVIVWDAATGAILHTLLMPDSGDTRPPFVYAASFSPDDSRILALSGYSNTIWNDPGNNAVLWDAATGNKLFVFHHTQGINAASFSPDGAKVVTASNDSTARMWDAATGTTLFTVRHAGQVLVCSFSAVGNTFVTGGLDSVGIVWDAATGAKICTMHMTDPLQAAQFTHDGTKVVCTDYNTHLRSFDAASGALIHEMPNSVEIIGAEFTSDDQHVLTWGGVTIQMFNISTGAPEFTADMPEYDGLAVSFSPDDKHILEASGYSAMVYDATNGKRTLWIDGDRNSVASATFSHDGTKVLSSSYDGNSYLWDASNGAPLMPYINESAGAVYHAQFDSNDAQFLAAMENGKALLWDAVGDSVLVTYPKLADRANIVGFSPDRTQIFEGTETGTATDEIKLCNRQTGAMMSQFTSSGILWAEYSKDGSMFAMATEGSPFATALIYDSHTGAGINNWEQTGQMNVARFSPDDSMVLTTNLDGTAKVFNLHAALTPKLYLQGNAGGVLYGEWSPDGSKIMTLCADTVIQLWDVATGNLLYSMHGPKGPMKLARFNNDGTMIAAAGDSTGYVWDAVHGVLLNELVGHSLTINSIAWNPAGNRIVTASDDKTTKIWGPMFPATSVAETKLVPDVMQLQCYPNPCMRSGTAENVLFTLPQRASVTVSLFDPLGRAVMVSSLHNAQQGTNVVPVALPRELPAGAYRWVLRTGSGFLSAPLVIMK